MTYLYDVLKCINIISLGLDKLPHNQQKSPTKRNDLILHDHPKDYTFNSIFELKSCKIIPLHNIQYTSSKKVKHQNIYLFFFTSACVRSSVLIERFSCEPRISKWELTDEDGGKLLWLDGERSPPSSRLQKRNLSEHATIALHKLLKSENHAYLHDINIP